MRIFDYDEQYRVRKELDELFSTSDLSCENLVSDAFHSADQSTLTFEETQRMYTHVANVVYDRSRVRGVGESAPPSMPEVLTHSWQECEKKGDVRDARSSSDLKILSVPSELEKEVNFPDADLMVHLEGVVALKQKPVSRAWIPIVASSMEAYLSAIEESGVDITGQSDSLMRVMADADYAAATAQSTMTNTIADTKPNAYLAVAKLQSSIYSSWCKSSEEFIAYAKSNPCIVMGVLDHLDEVVSSVSGSNETFVHPLNLEEAYMRVQTHAFTLMEHSRLHALINSQPPSKRPTMLLEGFQIQELIPIAQRMMDRIPEHVSPGDPEFNDLIKILCPELLENVDVYRRVHFTRAGGRIHVVYPQEIKNEFDPYLAKLTAGRAFIQNPRTVTNVDRRTLKGTLRDVHGWTEDSRASTFPLCTIQELEAHYFQSQDINGRFLMDPNEDSSHTEQIDSISTAHESHDEDEISQRQRLNTVKILLLRNGLSATFSRDDSDKRSNAGETAPNYTSVDNGHYVIVTIPELGMQLAISDDYGKAMYLVYNNLPVDDYTHTSPQQLRDTIGATASVRWEDRDQWMHSVGNTLAQQKADPKRVYPVNTSYPTPLDNFPNEEALEILLRENQFVADASGKGDEPWLTRVTDYTREQLHSGEHLWSFGGEGAGGTYLDRLSREFGLRETETGVRQDLFRRMMLKLVLYECYPEYRELQQH